ncbi:PQQ-like beta-propeller repeat protein [bacterium]|nr:PQQ-like beta-propeller repeat protein [bacterium]
MKTNLCMSVLLIAAVTMLSCSPPATGQDSDAWTMFRGPNGSGVSSARNLPADIAPELNVVWKRPLATGFSSPVLTGSLMLLTAEEEGDLYTLCLRQRDGTTVWKRKAPRPRRERIDARNHPASPSAATDGKNVYVFFADFGMLAYDLQGTELWQLPLGPFNNAYGMGASPVTANGMVILVIDQQTDSFIIGVDAGTGKIVWRQERPQATSGHSTPVFWTPKGGEIQVLVPGSFLLTAYSVRTGEKIWWVDGLSFEMKSTPVIHHGMIYVNGYATPMNQPGQQMEVPEFEAALASFDGNGDRLIARGELPREPVYQWFDFVDLNTDGMLDVNEWRYYQAALASLNGMLAIRLGGEGDMSASNHVWNYRRAVPQLPSPLIYNNVLLMINDGGTVTTFNPDNGEVISTGRLQGAGSHFYASPVGADEKVYIISRRGTVTVLPSDGSLEPLAQHNLGEEVNATPAIADGRIYLRTNETLYCFGK